MNRQILDLSKRWDSLHTRVQAKLDDNKRITERRQEFERNFSKLFNLLVLIDSEGDSWKVRRDGLEWSNNSAIAVCNSPIMTRVDPRIFLGKNALL